jgi:hypothetical protein
MQGHFEDLPPTGFDNTVGQETPVQVSFEMGEEQWRAIAKISFNYLIAIHGKSLALESHFNEIRTYIALVDGLGQRTSLHHQPLS